MIDRAMPVGENGLPTCRRANAIMAASAFRLHPSCKYENDGFLPVRSASSCECSLRVRPGWGSCLFESLKCHHSNRVVENSEHRRHLAVGARALALPPQGVAK